MVDGTVIFSFVPSPTQSSIYDKLKNELSSDYLTGVLSRRSILEAAERNGTKCKDGLHVCSFLMIDIDHFKHVNDRYGHDVGDIVLKNVAATIKGALRESDSIGRLGGEEFLVLLPATSSKGATTVATKILGAVERKEIVVDGSDSSLSVTVSIGISSIDSFIGCDVDGALKSSDTALYAAKANGRNCYECIVN
ncbi:MAG: GGDEF domain-containing protein [Paludibacter sp.]|nr:GGDEF domain-containing protein [Paludibacter sp.]